MNRTGERGFTLIELVVVAAIMALVFALAAAQLDWIFPKYELRAVAREIGAIMKQARSRALGTGKDVYVVFDLSEKKYWILAAFPANEDEEELDPDEPPPIVPSGFVYERIFVHQLPDDVSIKSVIVGRGVVVESGQARVRMAPFGMGDHFIVNIYNESDLEIAIRFNGFTGHLKFYKEHRGPEQVLEDLGP